MKETKVRKRRRKSRKKVRHNYRIATGVFGIIFLCAAAFILFFYGKQKRFRQMKKRKKPYIPMRRIWTIP